METVKERKKVHMGRNVSRFRFAKGLSQEELGKLLGMKLQEVAALENKEVIEEKVLEKIAPVFDIPVDVFQTFPDEEVANIFIQNNNNNTFNEPGNIATQMNDFNPTVNNPIEPIKSMVELVIENEKKQRELLELKVKEMQEVMDEAKSIITKLQKQAGNK